jgi:DNA primase
MIIVMQYAQRYFSETMLQIDEGKSIGLGYFKERDLKDDIISKFQLGYSLEEKNSFTNTAIKNGYSPKYLAKTGMSILSNRYVEGNEIKGNDLFDRYAGRVMFPIHDDGGRVVAFGGRSLTKDKKIAKYINSPETEIYNKSKILYGLWLGKKTIQEKDACYLVEGYMDVIAMHQAGIENVVASSGTSLTVDQIKSIHRFTKNIVVLYDGDEAGQKASSRAIPLLLEEGMNVKLLQFPDNDDPDSFSRKVTIQEFHDYIETNVTDFLYFKTKKLKEQTKNDPIKLAGVIKDIVENIAIIPDNIIRSIYIKECSNIMEIEESILQLEVNKIRRKVSPKQKKDDSVLDENSQTEILNQTNFQETNENTVLKFDSEEKELLRIMLLHGNILVKIDAETENEVAADDLEITISEFILYELWRDQISFENPIHQVILDEYILELSHDRIPTIQHFSMSQNPIISSFVINNIINNYELSNKWEKLGVYISEEINNIKKSTENLLFSLKEKKINSFINQKQDLLKLTNPEETEHIIKEIIQLIDLKKRVNKLLGRIVIK